jgi:hypothetical protein
MAFRRKIKNIEDFVVIYRIFIDDLLTNWQEWLTVSAYLGLTIFVIWGVFTTKS